MTTYFDLLPCDIVQKIYDKKRQLEIQGDRYKGDEILNYIYSQYSHQELMNIYEDDQDNIICEVHDRLFNTELYISSQKDAITWIGSIENYITMQQLVEQYDTQHYGSVFTKLTNPIEVVNKYVYIVGEEICGNIICWFRDICYRCNESSDDEIGRMRARREEQRSRLKRDSVPFIYFDGTC